MKNYKLLLAGLLLLLLIIILGILTWLWLHNAKNINPLPIVYNNSTPSATESEEDTLAISMLHLQAPDSLKAPLDDIITRFESRYPKIQTQAHYVTPDSLLTIPDTAAATDHPSPFTINTDMIIANAKLSQTQLDELQASLKKVQAKANQTLIKGVTSGNVESVIQETVQASGNDNNSVNAPTNITKSTDDDIRSLVSFSYALKGKQSVEGVILTNNPAAITFRNFLLSSTSQDILKQYHYDNIDGYKSSVDDLFNPSSTGKKLAEQAPLKINEVLSNGK